MGLCTKAGFQKILSWVSLGWYAPTERRSIQIRFFIFFPMIHEAWISLSGNRLRAFLAMLGIIIGVASVVMMVAIGLGSKKAIEESISALGTNQLIINPGSSLNKGLRVSDISHFEVKDATAIAQLPSVRVAAPATYPRNFTASVGKLNWDMPTIATLPDFFTVRNWLIAEGDFFTAADVQNSNRVVVLGSTLVDKLFGGQAALGRTVSLYNIPFRVVGILQSKGQGFDGRDQDNIAFIPFTTGKVYLWGSSIYTSMVQVIYVQVISHEAMDAATEEITQLLRSRFKLHESDADNFTIRNLTSITQVATDTNRAFSLLLEAIASISLLVGSIGIMNIMLVTVTERTREIGIRKAIGATENQILLQFLLESMMISLVGSLVGLLVGFGCGMAASRWAALPVEFNLMPVILSFVMAVGIGITSGLYPAWKAAKMLPIEALRSING